MQDQPAPHHTVPSRAPRLNPLAWLVFALSLLLVGGSIAQKAYRLSLPTDGWAFHDGDVGSAYQDHPIYDRNLFDKPSPLRRGDVLLAIDGHSYQQLLARARGIGAPRLPSWQAGSSIRYTVVRRGQKITLSVPLYSWNPLRALLAILTDLSVLAAVPLALLGWFVLFRRPGAWAARPLLLLSVSLLATDISSSTVDWGAPEVAAPLIVPAWAFYSNLIFAMVLLPSLLLVTLTCPRPKTLVRRFPWSATAAIYGIGPVLLLVVGPNAPVFWLTTLGMALASVVLVIVSVIREKGPVERVQARWALLGIGVMAAGLVVVILAGFGLIGGVPTWVAALWFPAMLTAAALGFVVAIVQYRLFEIDIIMNRLLVYGGLTLGVVLLYVGIVGYFTELLHVRNTVVPSLIVTALVAVAFQPARAWLQQRVNRLMFGKRDAPYAVLAQLGERFEGGFAPDAVVPTLVETVAQELKLPYVAISLEGQEPQNGRSSIGAPEGDVTTFPLVYQGEQVGSLQVSARRGESSLSDPDRRLLTHLAQRAGIGVYSVRLTNHLRQLSTDLQHSRQRLVEAREEERSRLRRDLHDDLAPTLAGLAFSAGTLQRLVDRDPARARSLAHELELSIRDTVGEVRRLVYDLRPPTLDDLGLLAAIRERAEQFSGADGANGRPIVRTDLPSTLPPLPAAVEVAVYRIVQEALMNVERHAAARCCTVRLWIDGALHLEIVDDGVGLPAGYRHGVGLRSMRDRADELGGRFSIGPGEGSGTSLRVSFPLQGGRST